MSKIISYIAYYIALSFYSVSDLILDLFYENKDIDYKTFIKTTNAGKAHKFFWNIYTSLMAYSADKE